MVEAERKYQEAMETIELLEDEKSGLKSQVDVLQDTVQEMSSKISEMHNKASMVSEKDLALSISLKKMETSLCSCCMFGPIKGLARMKQEYK